MFNDHHNDNAKQKQQQTWIRTDWRERQEEVRSQKGETKAWRQMEGRMAEEKKEEVKVWS